MIFHKLNYLLLLSIQTRANDNVFCFFVQSQIDTKDRLIKKQQTKLEEFEKEKMKSLETDANAQDSRNVVETANSATQTERVCINSIAIYCLTELIPFVIIVII